MFARTDSNFTQRVKNGGNMKIANNLYKVELKKSEEAVTGKIGLGWMADSLRHFGIKNWSLLILEPFSKSLGFYFQYFSGIRVL
jgi:hypothetical protein